MPQTYRKPAPKRAKRINHDHGGVPQLAAQIAGVSVFMVYGRDLRSSEVGARAAGHRGSRTPTASGQRPRGMNGSLVSVESGQIRVLPSFADMLVVQRLGGRFAGASRRWIWPATHRERGAALEASAAGADDARVRCSPFRRTAEPVRENQCTRETAAPEISGEVPVPVAAPEGSGTGDRRFRTGCYHAPLAAPEGGVQVLHRSVRAGSAAFCWRWAWARASRSSPACCVLHLAARRMLIACPLRVVPVWVTQFERHVDIARRDRRARRGRRLRRQEAGDAPRRR